MYMSDNSPTNKVGFLKSTSLRLESAFGGGKGGFLIGCEITGNPYADEPCRSRWEKGWKQGKFEWEGTFIRTGAAAHAGGLTLEDNPFRSFARKKLWIKGWYSSKRKAEVKVHYAKYRPGAQTVSRDGAARLSVVAR